MPSIQAIEERFKNTVGTLGRAALSALYPKDFEAYLLAIELVNSRGATVDYFAWPVLPSEIRESDTAITNIRKTLSGVHVLKNPTFNPRQISIRGDFGRRFKLLIGGQNVVFAGFGLSMQSGRFSADPPQFLKNPVPQFSTFAKTGYGCVKMLEGIKDKSKALDEDNKPYIVYLYNPILGNNYQVEFNSFVQAQDDKHYNMFPMYNIQMTAIAPLDTVLSRGQNLKSAVKNLTVGLLQKKANTIANSLRAGELTL